MPLQHPGGWLLLTLVLPLPMGLAVGPPAFPGAEGFGADTPGGRGGQVLFVTTLDDYDPAAGKAISGTLREACLTRGPRIVLFRVSGTIALKAPLRISEPYLTLAAQTAPGGGICLKDYETSIRTHDVIVRHMRFRPGDEVAAARHQAGKRFEPDALCIAEGSRNVIIDHCSASWSIDETLSVSGEGITNVTVQWCMITESLNASFHGKGHHGYGSLLRCNGNVTFHHNLYAHHNSRTPRPGTYGAGSILLDFRNNLVYDAMRGGYTAEDPARMNYVANCIKGGPSSIWKCAFSIGGESTQVYARDNQVISLAPRQQGGWELMSKLRDVNRRDVPFPAAPVATDTPDRAWERVLSGSGATQPARDAVDARIVRQVRSGTGRVIDSQQQVGGWPELAASAPPADADDDGMPDLWEDAHGLDPRQATDGAGDPDGDRYTNIEEFLNGTDPRRPD